MRYKDDRYIKLCEVGDTIYKISKNQIVEIKITNIDCFDEYIYYNGKNSFFNREIGKFYFKTKEEAEKELKRKEKISEKRRLLKEYEKILNKKLNLENHIIFK